MSAERRFNPEEASALVIGILSRHGMSVEYAAIVADHLVDAELVGCPEMGLIRLKLVVDLLAKGETGPMSVSRETPISALVDGAGNPGYVSVDFAMRIAIEKALATSIAVVGVARSSLAGMAGYYVEKAAAQGLSGMMFTSSYGRVAPHGGIDPILGTNPIAFGFPAEPFPVIFDASTSGVSNAQVEMARLLGVPIPPDVAVDADGHATVEPAQAQAGALLPAALHKGYGLALAVQILGLMVGGDAVPQGLGNQGILLVVLDPDMFIPRDEFQARLDELVVRLKSSRPADGVDEVLIPGEGRSKRRQLNRQRGIAMPEEVLGLLSDL